MTLKELYKSKNIDDKERIGTAKNILLLIPDAKYDFVASLSLLGLTKYEVCTTWPKNGITFEEEYDALQPSLVIQLGNKVYRKFHYYDGGQVSDALKQAIDKSVADAFVNLHHHDEFSLQDGLGTVGHLAKLLESQRRGFCCVTNHGSVSGWIKQHNICKKYGLKSLYGCEMYVNNYRGDDPDMKKLNRESRHLILIAKTKEGFDNIIKIHNDAQLNGFYYKPRCNWDAFKKWGKGVCATSSCAGGEISHFLMEDQEDKAQEVYDTYKACFDEFHIEIQIIEFEYQRELNRRLIKFAQKNKASMVLAVDSHYLKPEHTETHDLLLLIRQKKTILDKREGEEDIWNFEVSNLYYRNASQVREVFENGFVDKKGIAHAPFKDDVFTEEVFVGAMRHTLLIARSCEDIKLDSAIKLPKLYPNSREIFRAKVNEGFKRLGLNYKPNAAVYRARIKHEFEVVDKLGWCDYFLVMERIVSDTVAKFGEWSIGWGRGSAAGALISYCLGLTFCDPIVHNLLFERFLDESRSDPPDIDTDFDPRVRGWVKKHIVEIFSEDKTCSIGTYTCYKTRAIIIDVARALGLDTMEVMTVTKRMDPLKSFTDDDTDTEMKMDQMSFEQLFEHYPELRAYMEKHPEVQEHAEVLRNQAKNMGMHAGGMIISDLVLTDRIPVIRDQKSKKIISAWAESGSFNELSSVGLVKFDILSVNNLCVISDCVRLVKETKGITLTRATVPVDDRDSIFHGSQEDLVGIFQFENAAVKPVVDAVKMESLNDASAITSLIRPGPKDMGMDMEYAKRKNGSPYDMPEILKNMLSDTFGVIVYQESCMLISKELSGFTGPEANKLRKAIGKKQIDVMATMKEKFINGAQPRIDAGEVTKEDVIYTYDLIEKFAGYGFNKSHSIAYSALSCAELWLKWTYPVQFLAALINNTKANKKKAGTSNLLVDYINYARRHSIPVLQPDINLSKATFSIEQMINIRYAFSHVRNVAKSAPSIMAGQPYASMEDFYERCVMVPFDDPYVYEEDDEDEESTETPKEAEEDAIPVQVPGKKVKPRKPGKKVVESLIYAGAFDRFGGRNEMMAKYYALRAKKKEVAPELTEDQLMEKEIEMIGLILSKPPIVQKYASLITQCKYTTIRDRTGKKRCLVFGQVEHIKPHTSKAGNSMFIVTYSDGLDSMQFFVFEGGKMMFTEKYRTGVMAAMPLKKFDDSETWFFDTNNDNGGVIEVP